MPTLSCAACCTVVLLAPVCRCFSHVSCAAVAASGNGRCWAGALNPLSSSPGCCFPFAAASSVGVLHWAQWLHRCAVPHPLFLGCCAVLSEQEKKRASEKAKKQRKKQEAGCPKMESGNVSFSPFFFFQTETKESDRQGQRKEEEEEERKASQLLSTKKEGG